MVAMVSIKAKSLQAVLAGVFGRCLQQLHHFSLNSLCRTEWLCSDEP